MLGRSRDQHFKLFAAGAKPLPLYGRGHVRFYCWMRVTLPRPSVSYWTSASQF